MVRPLSAARPSKGASCGTGVVAGFAFAAPRQFFFFEDVFADDAEVNDTGENEAGDVVIAHAQQVNGQVLGAGDQFLFGEVDFHAAAAQQFGGISA